MGKQKFLILTPNYPDNNGNVSMTFVRTRNVYYHTHSVDLDVINFASDTEYTIDGINVHPVKWFSEEKAKDYDILICHAPNLRNHYKFLRRHGNRFKKIVFFFHGHEVLKINKVYPKPYPFIKQNKIKRFLQNQYDNIKLFIWRKYFNNHFQKTYCIFVSEWMRDEFFKWTKINPFVLDGRQFITYNSIGEVFEKESFNYGSPKKYDFITIRSVLDGSKYAIDIVNNLALHNPSLSFLVIGKGEFFNHYKKAPNLIWINDRLSHRQMCSLMNEAKCALMPTRTDAQGVAMCEMAAFGMPLITSDIPVCHEVFKDVKGIGFIDNNNPLKVPLNQIYNDIAKDYEKCKKYNYSIVGASELNTLNYILKL